MEMDLEVKNVISELQSGHGSSLYSALIMIRTTLIKSKNSLTQLVQMGAVKLLVQLLEDRRRHKNQTKTTDIVMSILANLCLEEDVREQVVCCDGLSVIARVTLSEEQESIQNRGVRALANLALDASNCEKIFQMEVPAFVAKRLMESEDVECRSTYCRALQLFGQTGKDAKRLMEETQAIQALAALLKLDNRKLAVKSLRILSELSALCCCPSFTGQILAANILEELVTLADDEDSTSASCSLSIILRLCEQEIMRPALGSAGIISLLVKLMRNDKSCINKVLALNALCLCTKEAVNRNKIQEAGGLELFILALKINGLGPFSGGQFSVLYDRIISSLVNFLYNDECLGKLLELGLVNILLEHLKRSCAFTLVDDDLRTEIDSFAESFEANSEGKGGRLERGVRSNAASLGSSTCHKDDINALDTNYAASSVLEFPSTSTQEKDTKDDPDKDCLESPSNSPIIQDEIDSTVHRVPEAQLNTDGVRRDCVVDKNSDEMMEDVEVELLTSSENLEIPFQHSGKARHTFSINSPTYQIETAWKLEDYTSGVTCKTFNLDPEPQSMSQHQSFSPYSLNTDQLQAPYSPLSAGASYYSPSQSSTSPSVLLSPVQSTIPGSPTSVSYRGSPTWAYSSPENENFLASAARLYSPHSFASMSPLSLAYQNQFSPLDNTFPASPLHLFGERYSQSPTPSSQNSPFSQSTGFPCQDKSEPMDQLLAAPGTTPEALFTAVPLSQGTVTSEHIYSASEDDDEEDTNGCDDDSELNPSYSTGDKFPTEGAELFQEDTAGCSGHDSNINSFAKSGSARLVSHKRGKTGNSFTDGSISGQQVKSAETSKRRRLNHASESVRRHAGEGFSVEHIFGSNKNRAENVSKAVDNSIGSASNNGLSDDEDMKSLPQILRTVNSATCSLKLKAELNDALPETEGDKDIQRPSSSCSTLGFEKVRQKSFQRLASFPGKEKRLAKTSHFRKHFSGTLSSTPRMTGSPVASSVSGTDVSDSPYRSPYPDPAQNDSQGIKMGQETKTSKAIMRSNSEDLFSSPLPENSSKASDFDEPRRGVSSFTKTDTKEKSDHSVDDARVKKIRRTTEANILILLARVSVKINPTQLLAESTVVSCLLGYIASAPNPIRRSCRILYRLCSNPHCFEKLILMQTPALIVKTLVLENDGTFPHSLFCSDNRNIVDFLPSSQGSECSGSQTSEFGRKMDFEFAGDAYSKLTSKMHSSIRSIFQNRHILVLDSESLRINQGGDNIYEAGSSRAESCVRIGLELLYTLGAVAMSKFGEGEIQHLLARHSAKSKLACVISMLHLQVGWCAITRDKFFTKYSLWDKVLPYLFTPEAPVVRETIVAAISLNVHLSNPGKLTQLVLKLPICPVLQSTTRHGQFKNKKFNKLVNSNSKSDSKPSLRNEEKTTLHADYVGSTILKKMSNEFVAGGLEIDEQTASGSRCETDHSAGDNSDSGALCPYQKVSQKYDVCFFVTDENKCLHKIHAQRKTLVEKSEVFAAMFSGSYTESVQSEINLLDVSKDAFEFIIHYLHGCSSDCPFIASLTMEYIKNKIIAADMCVRSESSSAVKKDEKTICDEEQNIEGKNAADKKESPCMVNNISELALEGGRIRSELTSAERYVRTDTSTNILQVLEFTQSQDSLDSLTLEDRLPSEDTSHACRKLSFYKNPFTVDSNEDADSQNSEDITYKCLNELISRCENILALADRFLLHDLMCYPASVLAHVCLCEVTVEDIFHLACFYHLDSLAFDCIRETLMSCLPCGEAAAIYLQLAEDGYREQVLTALQWLVNHMKND